MLFKSKVKKFELRLVLCTAKNRYLAILSKAIGNNGTLVGVLLFKVTVDVANMLGHTTLYATQHYAKPSDKKSKQ